MEGPMEEAQEKAQIRDTLAGDPHSPHEGRRGGRAKGMTAADARARQRPGYGCGGPNYCPNTCRVGARLFGLWADTHIFSRHWPRSAPGTPLGSAGPLLRAHSEPRRPSVLSPSARLGHSPMPDSPRAQSYRTMASYLRETAARFSSPDIRKQFEEIAQQYDALAENAEREAKRWGGG
jgi:hypothetical protein